MTRWSTLTVLFSLVLSTVVWAGPVPKELQVGDTKGIPPEILKQMNPDIVSGKRPTVEVLKQDDIFGLRDKPKRDTDFVRFDFDAAALSGAQRTVLDQWLKTSGSRVLLVDADIWNYRDLVGQVASASIGAWRQDRRATSTSRGDSVALRLQHPVCTDVASVEPRGFQVNRLRWYQNRGVWTDMASGQVLFGFSESSLAEGSAAMAAERPTPDVYKPADGLTRVVEDSHVKLYEWREKSEAPKRALVGTVSVGKSRVFFINTPEGPDQPRFLLNFWHWALDLKVPGAVDPTASGGTGVPKVILDAVRLKNGDTVSGRVLNESFTIKTSYATLTFKRAEVDTITIEGGGNNADEVRLVVGDRVSGVLQDAKVRVRLSGGSTTEVEKDKIKDVQIRGADEAGAPAGGDRK